MAKKFRRDGRYKFISDKTFKKGLPIVSDGTVAAYLKEISGMKPLAREEEERLGREILKGDHEAVNELVRHNLKYVIFLANKYRGCGISLCDLINEGNLGLIHSAHKFNPDKKVKFITYASWWIRQSIMNAIAEHSGTVRLPVKQAGLLSKIEEKYREIRQLKEREPTMEEIGKGLKISPEELLSIMRAYRTHFSLNTPVNKKLAPTYLDFLTKKEASSMETDMIRKDFNAEILELLKELPEREALILKLRFGFDGPPMTLEEIGKITGLSRERVRQIEKRAKEKLRAKTKTKLLKEYMA